MTRKMAKVEGCSYITQLTKKTNTREGGAIAKGGNS